MPIHTFGVAGQVGRQPEITRVVRNKDRLAERTEQIDAFQKISL